MADTTDTHELLVTTFATADALAKLLIEKGLITQEEFMGKTFRRTGNLSILHGNKRSGRVLVDLLNLPKTSVLTCWQRSFLSATTTFSNGKKSK